MYRKTILTTVMLFWLVSMHAQTRSERAGFDVCVYGGTSAGVIAAYTAAKYHKKVILIEPGDRLGGLSSGGLGFTDIGNKYVVTGLGRDFYRRIGQHYGKFEQWTFEPKVAEAIFKDYVARGKFKVVYNTRLKSVSKHGAAITQINLESSTGGAFVVRSVSAKEYIDCTYEGDLMAKAGVSYTTGREANSVYNETVNGVELKTGNQLPDGIDPYKIPGKPKSGLLWGISDAKLAPEGSGDDKIQAYNFRLCLTNDPENRLPITQPANYDATHYELLLRVIAKKQIKDIGEFLKMSIMPNHKTDINNNGGFSTDMIGMDYAYPDGDYATREAINKAHEDYTKGLLYFIGHDERIPQYLREQMLQWGYPKDEYLTTDHWSRQLYVREARRMLGSYIMTQANCQRREIVEDGVGMGAYNMDSHNAQRVVVNGMVKNEGDVQQRGINPYPIAYRSITPKKQECENLLVPVCLSASHMAYGSIRMEPVFMVLAQSAAVAACLATDRNIPLQTIDIKKLQKELADNPLADGSAPEILVDDADSLHVEKTGNWKRETTGGYGPSYLVDTSAAPAQVKFMPAIKTDGNYKVYAYFPKLSNGADATQIEIANGANTSVHTVLKQDIQVVGQTSGEWVALGESRFSKNGRAYIRISNAKAHGAVVADAVLLVPAFDKSVKK